MLPATTPEERVEREIERDGVLPARTPEERVEREIERDGVLPAMPPEERVERDREGWGVTCYDPGGEGSDDRTLSGADLTEGLEEEAVSGHSKQYAGHWEHGTQQTVQETDRHREQSDMLQSQVYAPNGTLFPI